MGKWSPPKWIIYFSPVVFTMFFVVGVAASAIYFKTGEVPVPPPNRDADGPKNVTPDPKGVEIPWIGLPPGEDKNIEIATAETIVKQIGEDTIDWSVKAVNAEKAWAKGITGKGVRNAVLDTGGMVNHRDLRDGIVNSKDFTGSRNGFNDVNGHGTWCLGAIGARKNNWGLQGVAYESELLNGKVLSDQGSGRVDWIAAGIDWAISENADVISMSLGGAGRDEWIPAALIRAESAGVIILAASGNDGNGRPVNFPAAYPQSNAIGAIDIGLSLAPFSCTGPQLFAVGPGVNARSTYPGSGDGVFANLSGTSMSTPIVAGVAALWIQANPHIPKKDRPAKWREWVSKNSKDLGTPGKDNSHGWGLPDCSNLEMKSEPKPPTPTDPVTPTPLPGIYLDENDLNEKGLKKLKDGKLKSFKLELLSGEEAKPKPAVPTISGAELKKRLDSGGTVIVFVGEDSVDLAKWPEGVFVSDLPEMDHGVYEVSSETVFQFKRISEPGSIAKAI